MKLHRKPFAALLVAALAAGSVHAGLGGETVGAQYLYPNIGDVYTDLGTAVVGGGVEFSIFNIDLDLSNSQITLSRPGEIVFSPGSFNGWRFYDATGTMGAITGVTVNGETTLAGFDNSRVSFDADNIWVNFVDLSDPGNFYAVVDVQMVPEPATYALMAAGLLAVGLARRSRRG